MRTRFSLLALVLVLIAEAPLLIPPPFGLTDHLVFWKAGQLVLSGASPYDPAGWIDAQRAYSSEHLKLFVDLASPVWVYPAWTAFLFVPFGALPYPAGPIALHISYLIAGLGAALLFVRSLPPRLQPRATLVLPMAAAFQPLVIADRDGQFGSFLLAGAALIFMGLRGERRVLPVVAGALLLSTKPQLFLVLAPVVAIVLVRDRAWRALAATAGTLLLVALLTTLRYPESVGYFTRGAGDRAAVFANYSSTWAFAQVIAGDAWPILGAILVAVAALATVLAIRALPADLRRAGLFAGAAVLSLALTPVDYHYDQIPLILALAVAIALADRARVTVLIWIVAIVIPWVLFYVGLRIGGPTSQAWSGAVPLLFSVLLFVAARDAARPRDPQRLRRSQA